MRELAEALAIPKSTLERLTKKPWFPARSEAGTWDLDEVKRAIASSEGRSAEAPVASSALRAKLSEAVDPVEQARAALSLASQRLAQADAGGVSSALEDLGGALSALRNTEKAFMDLSERRGELIERSVAKSLVGEAVARAIRVLERYEVQLAGKIEEWLGSADFKALQPDERARTVRAWARELAHTVRSMTADEIEKMIAAEVAERDA